MKWNERKSYLHKLKKIIRKPDLILITTILTLAIIVFAVYKIKQKTGLVVNVYIEGELVKTLSLDDDTRYEINNEFGCNMLVIEEKKAFVEVADCPDKICTEYKPICKTGETIVCLPHKLVIEVR